MSSGKNLLSTAHTRRWSGRLGDLAPTKRKPTGTSMGSLEMEMRRRSFPAWQNPRRGGQGSHTAQDFPEPRARGQRGESIPGVVRNSPYHRFRFKFTKSEKKLWLFMTLTALIICL